MAFLNLIPSNGVLLDVFKAFPGTARHLIRYHEALMRGRSPLSGSQRELIAAYVSGLNACTYCHGIHTVTAEALGVSEGLVQALVKDVESAPVDERLRPILQLVRKLTTLPSRVGPGDIAAVRDAGWDDAAIHDAVAVCALFNFMNRYVEGLGLSADENYFQVAGRRIREGGYAGLLRLLPADGE